MLEIEVGFEGDKYSKLVFIKSILMNALKQRKHKLDDFNAGFDLINQHLQMCGHLISLSTNATQAGPDPNQIITLPKYDGFKRSDC